MTKNLRCTFCGGKIIVNLAWEGRPYLQEQVPDSFSCDECCVEWDLDGNVTYDGTRWLDTLQVSD